MTPDADEMAALWDSRVADGLCLVPTCDRRSRGMCSRHWKAAGRLNRARVGAALRGDDVWELLEAMREAIDAALGADVA